MIEIFRLIWWLAPAGMANMTPPIAAKIWPRWNQPIDGKREFRGKRIFGDHKTVRGLVVGVVVGGIVFWLQKDVIKIIDYKDLPTAMGLLMAFGALAGDSIKSFFKRQIGVKPGNSWFPWDQTDWILGFMVFIWPVYQTPLLEAIKLIVLALGLHLVVKLIGFWLKLDDKAF